MAKEFRIHWLSCTVHQKFNQVFWLWSRHFQPYLGELVLAGYGGQGYKRIWLAQMGARVYTDPVSEDHDYCTFSLPGQACDLVPDVVFQDFVRALQEHEEDNGWKFRFTRLDLAFDGLNFKPRDVFEAIRVGEVESQLHRETLRWHEAPYEKRENGEVGTSGCYYGAGQSERMVRVYDLHGETRLELQCRGDRANQVARKILVLDPAEWSWLALGEVRSCLDLRHKGSVLLGFWQEFVDGVFKIKDVLATARRLVLTEMADWIQKQIGPALATVVDGLKDSQPGFLENLITTGRNKRNSKQKALLKMRPVPQEYFPIEVVLGGS